MTSKYEPSHNPDYRVGRREQALVWAGRQDEFEAQEMASALGTSKLNAQKVLSRLVKEGGVLKRVRLGVYVLETSP